MPTRQRLQHVSACRVRDANLDQCLGGSNANERVGRGADTREIRRRIRSSLGRSAPERRNDDCVVRSGEKHFKRDGELVRRSVHGDDDDDVVELVAQSDGEYEEEME